MSVADLRPSKVVTEEGGKYPFTDQPPTCPTAKSDINMDSVGEDLNTVEVGSPNHPSGHGHDTYQGIPGDGVVPR